MKYVFLDTNVFLHYQPIDQIPWPKIVQAESVKIIIPPVTVRELNNKKDSNSHYYMRERAGKTIKKLYALFSDSFEVTIQDKVSIVLEPDEPDIDFNAHHLNSDVQDDQLIASILTQHHKDSEVEMVLMTADEGVLLGGKARKQGVIAVVKTPNKYRLKEPENPDKKKIQQLERRIREIEASAPDLSLAFEGGEKHIRFELSPPDELTQDELELKLNEVKQRDTKSKPKEKHQQKPVTDSTLSDMQASLIRATQAMAMNHISEEEYQRYNTELEEFHQKYADYLKAHNQYQNLTRRTIKLSIILVNNGTAPAKDIDVFMHFPDGFHLLERFPQPPRRPRPPEKPRTVKETLNRALDFSFLPGNLFSEPSVHNMPPIAPNVSEPNITKTNSYEVDLYVQKAKHNLPESFDPLYVMFDSFEEANSFHIDYRLLAGNVQQEIKGTLDIIIEKEKKK